MADYQSPLQKQLDDLANWLRGNSDQVVDATKPATNYRGFPSRESVAASREAAKQRASDGPTFLSPDWFAKMYGQKSADTIPTVPAAVPDVVPATPALPAAPTRRPVRPALAAAPPVPTPNMGTPPTEEIDAFPPYRAPMAPDAVPAPAPTQPRQSYADMFKEILAQKQAKLEAPLSEDQKRALQLQFFLGMMSNSSKPGARIFGAMGDAGQTTLAAQQGMQKENLNRAEKERANQLETAYKMLDIRHKDESDQRLDRREATEAEYRKAQEKRFEAQDKRDQRKLDIEEKRLGEAGKKVTGHVMLGNGNIGLITGEGVTDSKVKGKTPASDTDPVTRQLAAISNFARGNQIEMTPQEILSRVLPPKFVTQDDQVGVNEMGEPVYKKRAYNASTGEPMVSPNRQFDTKPDPAPNKGRIWIDDMTKERFKSDGKTWVKVK